MFEVTQKWPSWITPRQLSCPRIWLQETDLLLIKNKIFCMSSKYQKFIKVFVLVFPKSSCQCPLFQVIVIKFISSAVSEMHLSFPLGTWTKIYKIWAKISNVENRVIQRKIFKTCLLNKTNTCEKDPSDTFFWISSIKNKMVRPKLFFMS